MHTSQIFEEFISSTADELECGKCLSASYVNITRQVCQLHKYIMAENYATFKIVKHLLCRTGFSLAVVMQKLVRCKVLHVEVWMA
jgi:hypothetical protein